MYEFLIKRNAEELEIVYSNLGLIYQNQKEYEKAINCYN